MPGTAANVDPGNDDRLSNASGDTLLLTDDPNAEVDTYASRTACNSTDYSRLTDEGRTETARYIGRDHRITDFE